MKPSRDENVSDNRTVRSNSAEYPSPAHSHVIQPHHYQAYQHAGDRRVLSKPAASGSPPPHLSTATTATSGTPTSSESMRSVSEGDHNRPTSATISANQSSSTPSPVSSSVPLSSVPSDQSTTWNRPQTPLVAAPAHQSGNNPSDLPEPVPGYEQGVSEARYNAAAFPAAIKILVSNNVAGSIIGRSGQTISDLQAQSSTRIKLSQAGDYFPGTQDRVCLVQGQADNVKRAVNMLLTRLYALQQQQHYHHFAWQRQQQERGLMHEGMFGGPDPNLHPPIIPGFAFVVRVLVPVPCCGMIIGKGGTNIKQMVDSSGVSSVRLSPKDSCDPDAPYQPGPTATAAMISATAERVVSITGPDLNSCLNCLHIILDGMTSHPDISRYANMTTSYTKVISAAQNALAGSTGASSGARRSDEGADTLLGGQATHDAYGAPIERSSSHGYLDRQLQGSGHGAPLLRPSPSPIPISENMGQYQAFGGQPAPFLPHDNPVRPPLQSMQAPVFLMPSTLMPNTARSPFPGGSAVDDGSGLQISHSAPDLLALHMQNSLRVSEPQEVSQMGFPPGSTSFAHQIPQPTHSPPGFVAQVAIADNLVGSILGRGGRTLNELQVLSNTRIRISQRGEYLPGTKNRVVTIRGPTAQSVSTAQFLMNQRMVLPPTASTFMERPDYGGAGPYPDYQQHS